MPLLPEKDKIRCVIYDCDGVLFDSLEAIGKLYEEVCLSLGRPPLSEEELQYVHCHTVFEAIRLISRNDPDLEEKAKAILKQIDLRKFVQYLKMEPHLQETLRRLKEKEILRTINTNRTTSMKYVMEDFQLWPHFDMVVTALDVQHSKPHPESVEKILHAFHLEREEAVFVGDSEVDQRAAGASGVLFIAYKNKTLPHALHIEDHLDLLRLV